jgi:Flp pilus assembly pilin Flp
MITGDEIGQSLIEFLLLVGLITLVAIVTSVLFGDFGLAVNDVWKAMTQPNQTTPFGSLPVYRS